MARNTLTHAFTFVYYFVLQPVSLNERLYINVWLTLVANGSSNASALFYFNGIGKNTCAR